MTSRTTAFGDRIDEMTVGEGIDVVLNTLSGEAGIRGIQLLRPFGRFLQIDKQDIAVADPRLARRRRMPKLSTLLASRARQFCAPCYRFASSPVIDGDAVPRLREDVRDPVPHLPRADDDARHRHTDVDLRRAARACFGYAGKRIHRRMQLERRCPRVSHDRKLRSATVHRDSEGN